MMRKARPTLLGLVGLVVFAWLLLTGCAGVTPTTSVSVPSIAAPSLPTGQPTEIQATVPQNGMTLIATTTPAFKSSETLPIGVKLAISHPPRLGETAYLTVTAVSVRDAPNSEVRIELPADASLLTGSLRWQGALTANVPVQFSAAIRMVKSGQKTIRAIAKSVTSETSSVSDVDEIVLDVTETAGQFHAYDPRTPQPIEKLVPGHAPVTVYPDAPPVLSGTQPPAMPVPSVAPTPTSDPPAQRSESIPVSPKLEISHPPRLGETVSVTCTVMATRDIADASARIELPDGAVLVDGESTWRGALKTDVPVRFSMRIKFVREGTFDVIASAVMYENGSPGRGKGDGFLLFVSKDEGRFMLPNPAGGPTSPRPPIVPLTPPPPQAAPVTTRQPGIVITTTPDVKRSDMIPISPKLEISHPPRLEETATPHLGRASLLWYTRPCL